MGQTPRSHPRRPGFRRAAAVSVAVHLALAAVILVTVSRPGDKPDPARPGIDTRADEVTVRLDAVEIPVRPEPEPPPWQATNPPAEPPASQPGLAGMPLVGRVPGPLPAGMLEHIRRSQPAPSADPNVRPAAVADPPARPIHGAMRPGQSVVYVLDCSGSMGEFGKLAAARAALVATLRRQPEGVRFQVLVYNSTTRPVLPGGLVPATAANVAAAESGLSAVGPVGRSDHAAAVRAAAALSPDVIVLLTDADDIPTPKPGSGQRPVPVWVARVTAAGVASPREPR